MNESEQGRLRDAEAQFREAVQREQSELMAAGVGRAEATEILLGRLRRSTHNHHDSRNNACGSSVAAPPPGFSAEELEALMKSYGYSREDALRALTICHEIRRLEAAGIGGVAAARELTQRVLDRRDVVGGGESAGGAHAGAGGGVVGGGGSGGVAETGGGIVSGGVGAEVDTGFKHAPQSPKHSHGCGEGNIPPEYGVEHPGSHRCSNNYSAHLPSKQPDGVNTNSATPPSKSCLVHGCGKPNGKTQPAGGVGGLELSPTVCRTTTAGPPASGCVGGAAAGVDRNSGAAGGSAGAAWEVRLAGRKRQCASTVSEPMRSCSSVSNGFFTGGSGGGNADGISSGAGAPAARARGGEQGMFPAPSPSRAVAGGDILPLSQERRQQQQQQQASNSGLGVVVPSVMSIDDLAPRASERAPLTSREPMVMMCASDGVVAGLPAPAVVSSEATSLPLPMGGAELLQTRDPSSTSPSLSRNSERSDPGGIGSRGGGRRNSSSSSGGVGDVGMQQWSMANRHEGGGSGGDRNARVIGRPEGKEDGHSDDAADMMDVTVSSPPLISPATKRYRYQNGLHHCLTSGMSSSPGRVPPALGGVPPAGGTGGLGFHHEYHRMQAQHQQQEQIQRGGLGGRREGTREAHPLVFIHEQGLRRQEEQDRQLQLAFHQLGVRQRNATPSPSMLTSVQPKRPRGPDEDPSHGKRPRSG